MIAPAASLPLGCRRIQLNRSCKFGPHHEPVRQKASSRNGSICLRVSQDLMSLVVRHLYRFGPFDLDESQRSLRRGDKKITLPPKAIDLLLYLVKNPLRLITKEELLRAVWPD